MKRGVTGLVFVVVLLGAGVAVSIGVNTGSAQTTEEFNETYGGADLDSASSVAETSDGGFAIVGTTQSFGAGSNDAWLIKTDSDGNVRLNKTFGGVDFDTASSVIETADGGFAIVGTTESFGAGDDDAWLIKTNSSGYEQFNKTYDGGRVDAAFSVVETSDGGFALAGFTDSFGKGDDDALLIKTDENGNEQFNKTFGGAEFDGAASVVETSDGGFALAGETASSVPGFGDAWLIKTDENGNEQFNKTFGGADNDFTRSVVETSDGGFALAAQTESFGGGPGSADAWFIKTDENGNEQFNKTFGGAPPDDARSVVETSGGGFALAGGTSFGAGISDAWLIKTDENGNEQFNKTFGGAAADVATSVVGTSDGGFALGGATRSFGAGDDDAWLLKLSESGSGGGCPFDPVVCSYDPNGDIGTGELQQAINDFIQNNIGTGDLQAVINAFIQDQ